MEVIEKRDYYRLEDNIQTEYKIVSEADIRQSASSEFFDLPQGFILLRELHLMNLEAAEMVRDLASQNLDLGSFLGNLNKRIELLTRSIFDIPNEPAGSVSILSEGGISFPSEHLVEVGAFVALKMLFQPSCLGLTCFGKVKHARFAQADGPYSIGIQFLDLSTGDEQLIARHILRQQAERRREQIRNEKYQ